MFVYYNPNPHVSTYEDCVIRALCKVTGKDWYQVRVELFLMSLHMGYYDWDNHVWGKYLKRLGFVQRLLPNTCPDCFTVRDFCRAFPHGTYLLAIGDHVVTAQEGDYFDTWDSGDEVPMYYWSR